VLCKANGILLPALALVLEYILLRTTANPAPQNRSYRRAMLLFAWLPTSVVAGYLLDQGWKGFVHGIAATRPWTLGQRLLTEPRVLMDYLGMLWLPRPFTPGLFNDNTAVSTSLWSPATTLPALLAVLGLIAAAWRWRHRHPLLATAVLFYFVGQSLESSTVALELYFEHRNYLPALLMFWPLAVWLCDAYRPSIPHMKLAWPSTNGGKAKALLAALLVLGLALMTHARAALWGNTHDQALLWAKLNPDSPRAQANAAQVEMSTGHPTLAIARLKPLLAESPDQAQLALNLLAAECQLGHVDPATLAVANTSLSTMRDPGSLLTQWFTRVIIQTPHPVCPELNTSNINTMLNSAHANPFLKDNTGRQQDLFYLKGRLALIQGAADSALIDFNRALDCQIRPAIALKQAALLGAAGFPRAGLAHLNYYEAKSRYAIHPDMGMPIIHAWVLQRQRYWSQELQRLRITLHEDVISRHLVDHDQRNH
jgi:tetratricopeptide (TPR) repeat protein